MLITRAIAARFCSKAAAQPSSKSLNPSIRRINRRQCPQNYSFYHFRLSIARSFATNHWLQLPDYDVELLRRGRLIAWLSYNSLGIRALSELVEYVTKSKEAAPEVPNRFGWFVTRALLGEGSISLLESILVAGESNAYEYRNEILAYFDINCYNLLLLHYCTKQDWPHAIALFRSLLDSTDPKKPKANYVSLILIHDLASTLGHADDLKISEPGLAELQATSVAAVDSWLVALFDLRWWQQLESWIIRARSNRKQFKPYPVRIGPTGGAAALRRLAMYTKVDEMLRFTTVLSRDRPLSAAEIEVVARELHKRQHADVGVWAQRLEEAGQDDSRSESDVSNLEWHLSRLSEVARALVTQRGPISLARFDRAICNVFFTKAADSQIERDHALALAEDTLDVWRKDKSVSLYSTLVMVSGNRRVAVSDYVLLRIMKRIVDMSDIPTALSFLGSLTASHVPSTPETRQLMYKLVLLCPAAKTIEDVKRLEYFARRDEATLFEPSLIAVFMKVYRNFSKEEVERLWEEMTIKRKMMPSSQALELYMSHLLWVQRLPALEALWSRVQGGEFTCVVTMPMYDIMIICFCATLNMPSLQNCIDQMVNTALQHNLKSRGFGGFLAMLKMGVRLRADVEWAKAAWQMFTASPIVDPAKFRIPPDAYRQMLQIHLNSGGVAKAIEYAEDCIAQAKRKECYLNMAFTAQFLSDVLIGGLKQQNPEELIRLSKWADFSQQSGSQRILTEEELVEFESVIAHAKRRLEDPNAKMDLSTPSMDVGEQDAEIDSDGTETSQRVNSPQ